MGATGRMRVLAVPLLLAGTCAVTACGSKAVASGSCSSHSVSAPASPGSAPASPASPGATYTPPTPTPVAIAIPGGLSAVAVASPGDAWAVGSGGNGGSLIVHWDGSRWREVPNPASQSDSGLLSVAATSACDAWAVGDVYAGSAGKFAGEWRTVIEHWDGRAWSLVPGKADGSLFSVAARSPGDAWAVGDSAFAHSDGVLGGGPPLIKHWNGRAWAVTPSPKVATGVLTGVAIVSANDAWAVGQTSSAALIEHWDGKSWQLISGPVVLNSSLAAVTAISASDIWAVGTIGDGWNTPKGLVEHWDGKAWTVVHSPSLGGASLAAVAASSADDVWAVGSDNSGQKEVTASGAASVTLSSQNLIEHWDGKAWKRVPSPGIGHHVGLSGVAAVSPKEAWAVGFQPTESDDLTSVQHWDGMSWRLSFKLPPGQIAA